MRSPVFFALCSFSIVAHGGGLYWSDRPTFSGSADAIRACNFDGTNLRNVRTLAANDDPRGVAVDVAGGRIYYATRSPAALHSIDFTGGGLVTHLTGLTTPADVRLDPVNRVLHWCEEGANQVRRAALGALPAVPGTLTPFTSFAGVSAPYYLDLDVPGARLYCGQSASSGNIFAGPLAGGTFDPAIYSGGLNIRGVGIDAAAAMLYWVERDGPTIRRRALAGGTVQTLYAGQNAPHGLRLDLPAGKMYWVDTGTGSGGLNPRGVTRGDLDGSGSAEIIATGALNVNQPWDIDLDPRTTTYAEWRGRFFRLDAATATTDKTADPEGDGSKNVLEYALGTPPLRGNAAPIEGLRVSESGSDYAAIRFHRRVGAGDVTYRVQVTSDFTTWRDNSQAGGPYTVETSAVPAEEGMEAVTVRAATSMTSAPGRQFLRVLVESPSSAAPLGRMPRRR